MNKRYWNLVIIIFVIVLNIVSCKRNSQRAIEQVEDNFTFKIYTDENYDNWKTAYKSIIMNAKKFLSDLSDPQEIRNDNWYAENLSLYLGIHDFDNNDIPELIFSDGVSIGVFTYENDYIKRIADISVREVPWVANGGHYANNCIYFQCDGSDGSYYVCWTYYGGEFVTGMYDDYMPEKYILNNNDTTKEKFAEVFKIDDMKNCDDNKIGYYMIDNTTGTLQAVRYNSNVLDEGEVVDIEYILDNDYFLGKCNTEEKQKSIIVKMDNITIKCSDSGIGIVEDIEKLTWMSLRSDEFENLGSIKEIENDYVLESKQVLIDDDIMIDSKGAGCWVRVINNINMPVAGTSITGHKDYLLYVDECDAYLMIQSYENLEYWSVYKLPDYGTWLKREIDIIIKCSTGL